MRLEDLKIKIFADGADLETIRKLRKNPLISGWTTNPSLCRKAGVTDYVAFAKKAVKIVSPQPISFEVFADDIEGMNRQARIIASWGKNVYVKIPITNTKGESTNALIQQLCSDGLRINVTAILTDEQVRQTASMLNHGVPSYVSIFAGRIADTQRNPIPIIEQAKWHLHGNDGAEIIWASPREVLNVRQANDIGCHIITATPDILAKLPLCGKNLAEFSMDTVKMFHDDAQKAGYFIQ